MLSVCGRSVRQLYVNTDTVVDCSLGKLCVAIDLLYILLSVCYLRLYLICFCSVIVFNIEFATTFKIIFDNNNNCFILDRSIEFVCFVSSLFRKRISQRPKTESDDFAIV